MLRLFEIFISLIGIPLIISHFWIAIVFYQIYGVLASAISLFFPIANALVGLALSPNEFKGPSLLFLGTITVLAFCGLLMGLQEDRRNKKMRDELILRLKDETIDTRGEITDDLLSIFERMKIERNPKD